MSPLPRKRTAASALLVTFLIISLASSTVSAAANDDLLLETDGVTVREDALLPLRADPGDAATAVPNTALVLTRPGTPDAPLNKDRVAVYQEGEEMTLAFESRTGVDLARYGNETARLVAARLDPDRDPDVAPLFRAPLDALRFRSVQENATFVEARDVPLDPDGENGSIPFTPDRAGAYAVFLVSCDDLELDGGDLSVTGNATVIGADAFPVHRNPSSVDAPDAADAGDDLAFRADSGLPSGETKHLVALYHEDTYADSFTKVRVTGLQSQGPNNVNVEPSIRWLNGVARLENDTSVFNRSLPGGRVEDSKMKVEDVYGFFETKAGVPTTGKIRLDVNPTGSDVLDASLTADRAGANATLRVETREDWRDGTYRWVHVAARNDALTATSTGTLEIEGDDEPPRGPGRDRGNDDVGGGSSGGGRGAGVGPGGDVEETFRRHTALALRPGERGDVEFPADSPVHRLGITVKDRTAFDPSASVGRYGQRPDDVRDPPGRVHGYLSITTSIPDGDLEEVEIEFTVEREWLDGHGLGADDVVLSRWHGGEWQDLETEVLDRGDGSATLVATSPGLSVFAVRADADQDRALSPDRGTETPDAPDERRTSRAGEGGRGDRGVPGAVLRNETATSTPGFAALTALAGLLAALALARRR